HAIGAECAQAHHAELGVAVDERLLGSPFHVEELAHRDEIDLGTEGAVPAEGKPEQPSEQRDVASRVCLPPGSEAVNRIAIAEEDRALALAYDQLGAQSELAGSRFRNAVDNLAASLIGIFDQVKDCHTPSSRVRVIRGGGGAICTPPPVALRVRVAVF